MMVNAFKMLLVSEVSIRDVFFFKRMFYFDVFHLLYLSGSILFMIYQITSWLQLRLLVRRAYDVIFSF